MPYTFEGIGTSLTRVSRKRNVEGHLQYDAIEAFGVFYCPLVPYKALHVLSTWKAGHEKDSYQAIPLRFSSRLVTKALLNGWGDGLTFVNGLIAVMMSLIIAKEEGPIGNIGWTILLILWSLVVLGVGLKLFYLAMNRTDERIKDIIGVHDHGTSDPYHWPDSVVWPVTESIREAQGQRPLIELAEESFHDNDRATAMYLTRIGMRVEPSPRFLELFERLMSEATQDGSPAQIITRSVSEGR